MRLSMLRKWFPPWPQPRNTIKHNKLIFYFFDFTTYCYCFFYCLCNFTYNVLFLPVLTKNLLLILPNNNVFPLSLFYYIYPPQLFCNNFACHGHMTKVSANWAQFVCKLDQGELQLDWSQLSYAEHSSPIQQEVVQPKITKGRYTT